MCNSLVLGRKVQHIFFLPGPISNKRRRQKEETLVFNTFVPMLLDKQWQFQPLNLTRIHRTLLASLAIEDTLKQKAKGSRQQ